MDLRGTQIRHVEYLHTLDSRKPYRSALRNRLCIHLETALVLDPIAVSEYEIKQVISSFWLAYCRGTKI